MDKNCNLAERYRIVRKHLDRLGYRQALSLDALPLIERLLADLIQTTDSLKHFKTVAQDNIEACSQLQLVTEPYKCDNARLVQECNQLHMKLLETDESNQKQIKELKKQVRKLDIASNDVQLLSAQYLKRIKELEAESAGKSAKIFELQGKCCKPVISSTHLVTKKRACYPLRRPTLEADPLPRTSSSSSALPSVKNVDPHIIDLVEMADHRMNCLNHELAKKEKEIMRLTKMLDGGRPLSAVTKDCFCKKMDKNHCEDVRDVEILECAKQDLEDRLKDSMEKQHEAMSRALKLAERNEKLEKELRDIDHIALAVEADCNSVVQQNNRRVCRLQKKVEDLMTQVHVLESELTIERRGARELRADLEACKLEKRNIQRVLESTLDEKKQMNDKMNQLTVIERDLNNTVERLTKSCAIQRQEIAQLESSEIILRDQIHTVSGSGHDNGDDREKEKGEKNDKNKGKKILKTRTATKVRPASPSVNKHSLNGHGENEVSKDVFNNLQAGKHTVENQKPEKDEDSTTYYLRKTIERLETERDYYRNEYNKFREKSNLLSNGDNADLWAQACELRRQLNEKEQVVAELQQERKALDREKFNLEARLHTSKNQQRRTCITCIPCSVSRPNVLGNFSTTSPLSGQDSDTTKAMLERLEQERDSARADVNRLAEERDALRERLKIAVDAHTSEQRRLREHLSEAETRLKQLETERQDLMLSQGTRRATINGLEDQLDDLRSELRRTKEELTTQRTQYFQLRALQEQTDQALGDVQGQLGQSETELNKMMDHRRNVEQRQMQLDNQVKELKEECNMLRANLTQLDQEKDQLLMNLDEKTERIAELERDVGSKEQQSGAFEQQVLDFQHKYRTCVEQSTEQERQMRTMDVEITNLQRQLQSAFMDRENAIRENSRIQDDLAAVTCECRNLQRELETSRAESYDLKRQLQTYVTEVRRAEELLNRKENERSEMLNHFRSLSLEATVLETNNQSLESEAAEARGALQTAQDRLLDLERQIADRDCLIGGYETQIAELTQNVASMETQLHQQDEQRKRVEADLNAVRDLCVKLDQQKNSLEAQLGEKDTMKLQYETQLSRLRADQNMVQDQMSRDNAAVDRLEAMLSQARQESMTNQAINQELQSEMTRLKQKIDDLQNKLHTETSELRRYQNQAAEYSKQISELRRQMTNERFDRARKEEEARRSFNSTPESFNVDLNVVI
ncbi:testis-specific gene 10 protein isoform X2 [Athalia rosae]|uniref:testis-specific gene 10 protein isoform X2 n=1 Tax=Athalia rosae TaxID=37344 RepID=UPI00203326EA|nr:testis-specific gene 10 protein isoform X2 [Athalia rosae]